MDRSAIRRIGRLAPPIMSLLALAICVTGWTGIVRDPPGDEGALAHLYQLVMTAQIPLIAMFCVIATRQGIRRNLPALGLQIALWISAMAALPVLGL